ncbi:MAG: 50S ribosomal protein L17 [Candidatus Woesebacteria bacterium]|jgi:large subunit ribosomal protein L17
MRHRVKKRHFNRNTNQRKALLRNLLISLFKEGQIVTTKSKAKESKRLADKLIYRASKANLNDRRILHRFFARRDVVNTLVDRIAPTMKDRVSGFTSIKVQGKRRGDNSEMVKLELLKKPARLKSLKSGKDHSKAKPRRKAAKAKSVTKKAAKSKKTVKKTKQVKAKK